MEYTTHYKKTKTTKFYEKLNLILFYCGFPNYWIEELNLPRKFTNIFNPFNQILRAIFPFLVLFEWAAYLTQDQLSEKYKSHLLLFATSHPMLIMFRELMAYNAEKVRHLFYNLAVALKEIQNDPKVEAEMIKKTLFYVTAMVLSCLLSVLLYSFDAVLEVTRSNGTFTTLITAYPQVDDKSGLANAARIFFFIIWCAFVTRIVGVYILVIPITTGLGYQFKNLQSYFESLNDIFERHDLSQNEMQALYEQRFQIGIKMHSDTLRCHEQTQAVCAGVFSVQIVFNISLLVILMADVVNSHRNFVNMFSALNTASWILIGTGFYMCNSGDITVEASQLSTAVYLSGWHNCVGQSSLRVRKLVTTTMANAQRPVVLKGLCIIDLSYQSYIKIVKSSFVVNQSFQCYFRTLITNYLRTKFFTYLQIKKTKTIAIN